MPRGLPVHKNPEEKVFGLVGSIISTDQGRVFVKKELDSRNIGWTPVLYGDYAYVPPPGGEELFP
jgi:hypothetical protein